jgi:hypothetical protein
MAVKEDLRKLFDETVVERLRVREQLEDALMEHDSSKDSKARDFFAKRAGELKARLLLLDQEYDNLRRSASRV